MKAMRKGAVTGATREALANNAEGTGAECRWQIGLARYRTTPAYAFTSDRSSTSE